MRPDSVDKREARKRYALEHGVTEADETRAHSRPTIGGAERVYVAMQQYRRGEGTPAERRRRISVNDYYVQVLIGSATV